MKATVAVIARAFLALSVSLSPLLAQTPGQQQPEFIRQGQQLMREGKSSESEWMSVGVDSGGDVNWLVFGRLDGVPRLERTWRK